MKTLITIKSQSDLPILLIIESKSVKGCILGAFQFMNQYNIDEIDLEYNGFTFNIEKKDMTLTGLRNKISEYNEWQEYKTR